MRLGDGALEDDWKIGTDRERQRDREKETERLCTCLSVCLCAVVRCLHPDQARFVLCLADAQNLTRFLNEIFATWALPWHSVITNGAHTRFSCASLSCCSQCVSVGSHAPPQSMSSLTSIPLGGGGRAHVGGAAVRLHAPDETDLTELKVQIRFLVASCLRRYERVGRRRSIYLFFILLVVSV
jgi:hypothetical protein